MSGGKRFFKSRVAPKQHINIAYASDDQGSDFSLTKQGNSTYIAFLATEYYINPNKLNAGFFTGLWIKAATIIEGYDDSTIGLNGSDKLEVKDTSLTETKLNLSWKTYSALITQASTNAPVAKIALDEFSTNGGGAQMVWSRANTGIYRLTNSSSTDFNLNNVTVAFANTVIVDFTTGDPGVLGFMGIVTKGANTIEVRTYNTSWVLADGILNGTDTYGYPVKIVTKIITPP